MKSLSRKSTGMRWHLTEHEGEGQWPQETAGRQLLACGRSLCSASQHYSQVTVLSLMGWDHD